MTDHQCMALCYNGCHHHCNAYCIDQRHADLIYSASPHYHTLPACTIHEFSRLFEAECGMRVTEIRAATEAPRAVIDDPNQGVRLEAGFPTGADPADEWPYLLFFEPADPTEMVATPRAGRSPNPV